MLKILASYPAGPTATNLIPFPKMKAAFEAATWLIEFRRCFAAELNEHAKAATSEP